MDVNVGIDEVIPFGLETEKKKLASSTEKSTSFYDDLGNGTLHRNVQYALVSSNMICWTIPYLCGKNHVIFTTLIYWEWFILMVTIPPMILNGVLPPDFPFSFSPIFTFCRARFCRVRGCPWDHSPVEDGMSQFSQIVSDRRTLLCVIKHGNWKIH